MAKRTRDGGTAKEKGKQSITPTSFVLIISQNWVRAQGPRLIKPGRP
jgi:hypothetical protein